MAIENNTTTEKTATECMGTPAAPAKKRKRRFAKSFSPIQHHSTWANRA